MGFRVDGEPPPFLIGNVSSFKWSSQVKLLITSNAFCIVQRATAVKNTRQYPFSTFSRSRVTELSKNKKDHCCGMAEAPPDFKAGWTCSRLLHFALSPELDRPALHFLNDWISPENPVWATSAYNQGKYGNSPISSRPKESQVVQKAQASGGVVFLCCQEFFNDSRRSELG
jgi:hypothetical protein